MQREIYFAECSGRIKIGIATNVQARLSQLRTGAGAPVKLIARVGGDLVTERALHRKLKAHRIDGEWYHDCSDVRAAIQNSVNNFTPGESVAEIRRATAGKFKAVAKAVWPTKTAEHLAFIALDFEPAGHRKTLRANSIAQSARSTRDIRPCKASSNRLVRK